MIGAVGWVAALIPLAVLSVVVVIAYALKGMGPVAYRRRSATVYAVILAVAGLPFGFALNFRATDTTLNGALLLLLTAVTALGLVWPWLSRVAYARLRPPNEA